MMTALTYVMKHIAFIASAQSALTLIQYATNLACMHAIVLTRRHSAPPRSSECLLALPLVLLGVLCTCVVDSDEVERLAGRCCS